MDRLPLPALLSQALVAFTIEFDNAFEHLVPHRTTNYGSTPGAYGAPWLVSMVMWMNFMQFIPEDGISVGDLQRQLHVDDKTIDARLTRMGKWWGYVVVDSSHIGSHSRRISRDDIVRPTAGGRKAIEVWRPLMGIIDQRWEERFSRSEIDQLRSVLCKVASHVAVNLPDGLPILGYGLFSRESDAVRANPVQGRSVARHRGESGQTLPALLSKTLLAFAVEFERGSKVSLAVSANILRLVDEHGVQLRDLPRLAGVSKEAIATGLSFLEKKGYAVIRPEVAHGRVKLALLTAEGGIVREAYYQRTSTIEKEWQRRFEEGTIHQLRGTLERIIAGPLLLGLEPYLDGWRASAGKSEVLPHYPMVMHRGGFPDGS